MGVFSIERDTMSKIYKKQRLQHEITKVIVFLTLFKPGFFWLSMTRGVDSTPLQKTMLQLS